MTAILVKVILMAVGLLGEDAAKEKERLAGLRLDALMTEAQAAGIALDLQAKINTYTCQKELLEREMKKYSIKAPEGGMLN